MTTKNKHLNLYWVSTPDHDEDCFIVASTGRSARSYHEGYEGYNSGDAEAELLFPLVDAYRYGASDQTHPRFDLLASLGAIKIKTGPREGKICLNGRCFPEFEPYSGMFGKPISNEPYNPNQSRERVVERVNAWPKWKREATGYPRPDEFLKEKNVVQSKQWTRFTSAVIWTPDAEDWGPTLWSA